VQLTSNGRLIALLPASCLTSEKDADALAEISASYVVKVIPTSEPARFTGCSVDVVVVQFQRRKGRSEASSDGKKNVYPFALSGLKNFSVAVVRGRVPMPDATKMQTKNGWPLVHTTGLRHDGVVFDQGKVDQKLQSMAGPVVLVSRVGRPSAKKICFYPDATPVVLSDCIIAVKADSARNTRILYGMLRSQARLLLQCYVGSCAKYLTLTRFASFLESLGMSVVEPQDLRHRESRSA
jgi:hypothetical protein